MSDLAFSTSVKGAIDGAVLIVTIDNPPFNLLSPSVRLGLLAALDRLNRSDELTGAVLRAVGKTFCGGADIREFGGPIADPQLPEVIAAVSNSRKPVVVALHGRALGGGFELALAARARIATDEAEIGLPEAKLGLLPGCGGIEGVTRLAGVEAALDLLTSGRNIPAARAVALGLVDEIATPDALVARTIAMTQTLPALPMPLSDPAAPEKIARFFAVQGRKLAGQDAPKAIAALIEAAALNPGADLSEQSKAAFFALAAGPQSAALRHIRAAEKLVDDVPLQGATGLPVAAVGVVGAGTMGSGIATAFLMAGFDVTITDTRHETLGRAREAIESNLAGAVGRGKLSPEKRSEALGRLKTATDLADLAASDLVIEAVYENMAIKQKLLAELDRICKPGAILASNTSFLDIDALAAATSRPQRVLGLHFFSPAHAMRLLEVVRGKETTPEVLRTGMDLGKRLGKIAVCVGNCHGFIGNRILLKRQTAAMKLLVGGVSPYRIDEAMLDFGLPMGPFQMADLAGLDVGWDRDHSASRSMEEVLCEAGRFGCKNGLGWYDYDDKGRPSPSPAAEELIAQHAPRLGANLGIEPAGAMTAAEILDALLTPMLTEVDAILSEEIALRRSDIDVVWVYGYGWPAYRGGPAWYAQNATSAPEKMVCHLESGRCG